MYNKNKYALNRVAGIISIVLGALQSFSCLILMISGIIYLSQPYNPESVYSIVNRDTGIALIVVSLFMLCLAIPLMAIGAKALKVPVKTEDGWDYYKGVTIALIVFNVLSFLSLLAIAALVCAIISLSQSSEPEKPQQVRTTTNVQSKSYFEKQIDELKHLKELGVIDEEQFKSAVTKLVRKLAQ